jgi:hypothetical protein
MLCQAAMLIIFFAAAVPKTANASPSGVRRRTDEFIFMLSHSVQSIAKPTAVLQLRYCFIFFEAIIFETLL